MICDTPQITGAAGGLILAAESDSERRRAPSGVRVILYILCKYQILHQDFLLLSLFTLTALPPTTPGVFFYFIFSPFPFFPFFSEICFGVWERRRSCAAKLTFTGVWPPPVILSTPSLCGAQPSETSDRRAEGSGQHNPPPLPSLCPVQRCDVHTHTAQRRKAHIFFKP